MSSNFIRGQMDECPDNDGDEPVAKKSTNMSMLSFLTGAPKASQTQSENTSNHLAKKRDYWKDKHVCMLCANDDNLKDKKIAILCRGTVHQLRRYYGCRHAKKRHKLCLFLNETIQRCFSH